MRKSADNSVCADDCSSGNTCHGVAPEEAPKDNTGGSIPDQISRTAYTACNKFIFFLQKKIRVHLRKIYGLEVLNNRH